MVKSKNNTWGYWQAPIVLVLVLISYIVSLAAGDGFLSDKKGFIIVSVMAFVMVLIYGSTLWVTSKVITINYFNKTIISTHLFTKKSIVYNFVDFDGYIDMVEKPGRGRPFRSIFLVKDEKFVLKISGLIYSNLDAMEAELKNLAYLGEQRYSWLKNLKIWFGRKALSDN